MEKSSLLRKPMAIFTAIALAITTCGVFSGVGLAFGDGAAPNEKFHVLVSSQDGDTTGSVKGTVYGDYTAQLDVSEGSVNTGNVAFEVFMQDVQSLGVTDARTYSRSFAFSGNNKSVPLTSVTGALAPLAGTTIVGKSGDSQVTYGVAKTEDSRHFTATPDSTENASAVWHTIVNEDTVATGTLPADDSFIVLANGSSLKTGNSVLEFHPGYDGNLLLDDFNNLADLESAIRKAIDLNETDTALDHSVVIELKAGTTLAMGSSYATLCKDATITIASDGIDGAQLAGYLSDLRAADTSASSEQLMHALFDMFSGVIDMIGGKQVTVSVDYAQEPVEDYKFRVRASSVDGGSTGSVTGTVYGDYTAKLEVAGETVNTGNVLVDLAMRDVASLGVEGERTYSKGFNFGNEGRSVGLSTVANALKVIDGTKVTGTCGDASVVYEVAKDDESGRTYTAAPDSEDNARAVWHAIVNDENIESDTKAKDDSFIILAKGSSLHVGSSELAFEEGSGDLLIDDLSNAAALNERIREAVALNTNAESVDGIIVKLAKGTTLALGTSYAKLLKDATITISIPDADTGTLEGYLAELRDAQPDASVNYMKQLFGMFAEALNMVGGKEISVNFEFGHEWGEPEWTWADDFSTAKTTFACAVCGEELEVAADVTPATTPATCTKAGKTVYTATAAFEGKDYTDSKEKAIEATGHDYAAVVTDPTCTTGGYTTYTCSKCGDSYKGDETPAAGHKWGEPVWAWADDYSAATAKFTCAVCSETEDVPATVASVEGNQVTYTATVEFEGKPYTATEAAPLDPNLKFRTRISSEASDGSVGSVTGSVYADYTAELAFAGDKVNRSNATVGFWMQNVASLGVEGARYYSKPVQTGLTGSDNQLSAVKSLFAPLGEEGTKIIGVCDGKQVAYSVSENTDGNIVAAPDTKENASAVWHAIVNKNNLEYGTTAEDDSYAVLANGSYLQVGGKLLEFESDADLRIDNLGDPDALAATVRGALKLSDADSISGAVAFLKPGTKLAMGTSYVELLNEVKVTVDVDGWDESGLASRLTELRSAEDGGKMITTLLGALGDAASGMSGKTTTVSFEFGHKWGEPEWTWAEDYSTAKATFACAVCGEEQEVAADVTPATTNATCTEAGKTVYTATVAFEGKDYTDSKEQAIEATGHDYAAVVTDPTCTTGGYTTYTCSKCGDSYKGDETPAAGHKWGEPEWTRSEDYSAFKATFTCTVCDESQTVSASVSVRSEGAKTIYTATVTFDGKEYTYTLATAGGNAGDVDKSALEQAIADAKAAKVPVSHKDGADVLETEQWTSVEAREDLAVAIAAAQKVYADEDATEEEVANATTALNSAIAAYNDAKQPGTLSVKKEKLLDALQNAAQDLVNTKVSEDGTDVDPADKWVPESAKKDFEDAIAAAQAVLDNPNATQAEIAEARADLAEASKAFDAAKKPGTKPASEEEQPVVIDEDDTPTSAAPGLTENQVEAFLASLTSDDDPAGSSFSPLRLMSKKTTKKSAKLQWKRVAGASKYVVYGAKCGKANKYKKVAQLAGSKKSLKAKKVAGKKMKKKTNYKFVVAAFGASGKMITMSKPIHVVTKGGKKGNYKKVKVRKTKQVKKRRLTLKAGKSAKVKVKLVKQRSSLKPVKHRKVRFESSNPSVAKVDERTGVVTGVKAGKAKVLAFAENGVYGTVTVTVK